MHEILDLALQLALSGDAELYGIIGLSLQVSLSAALIAAVLAFPFAALTAGVSFPGRMVVVTTMNALLGLPPVVVGLGVYLLLSRAGPLGDWGLLFTPKAMIIAQTILIFPIIAAIAHRTLCDYAAEYAEQFRAFRMSRRQIMITLLHEARLSLATAFAAGFGRAIAEVGAVMIVGGNIAGVTRVMTTAIALETSKGNLAQAMALGTMLLAIALGVNILIFALRAAASGAAGAHVQGPRIGIG